MRILFLALMIALLPLRGWVGDAMALERVTPSQTTHHAAAPATALPDCHEAHPDHAGMAGTASEDAGQASADCDTCTACQICHSVALTAVLPPTLTPDLPTLAPRSSLPQYASAERAAGFKPPIF